MLIVFRCGFLRLMNAPLRLIYSLGITTTIIVFLCVYCAKKQFVPLVKKNQFVTNLLCHWTGNQHTPKMLINCLHSILGIKDRFYDIISIQSIHFSCEIRKLWWLQGWLNDFVMSHFFFNQSNISGMNSIQRNSRFFSFFWDHALSQRKNLFRRFIIYKLLPQCFL